MNYRYLQILLRNWGGSCKELKRIHALAVTLGGLDNHQTLACELLNCYTKLGNSQEPNKLFHQIENPDIVSWTCLINHYIRAQEPRKAFCVFSQLMHTGSLRPDSYSIVAALSACGRRRDLTGGKIVHGIVLSFGLGLGLDPFVGNALIDMYGRNNDVEAAEMVFKLMERKDIASWNSLLNGFVRGNLLDSSRRVFDEMPQRNSVSWTAMITGYVKGKDPIQGLELFRNMKAEEEEHATVVTIVAVLSGCADIGALDFGQCIHGYIIKSNLGTGVAVNNALMDMYSKSGYLDISLKIFNEIPNKDVFSWTTLISGYAFHGKGNNALEVFSDMLKSRVIPNEVTFLTVLSACSHAGKLVEGRSLFNRMIEFYGLKPKIEHFGCMVDLLGRAGLLEEVKDFIEQMPMNPDAVIWRSFLNACLVHGNLNLAEMAGRMVIELEPNDDGVYTLLWNIYFSTNRQEEAIKIRKLMRNRKIKKKPGCSWVEVNGLIQEFTAEYTIDYARTEIFLVLESITEQIKAGSRIFLCGTRLDKHFESL